MTNAAHRRADRRYVLQRTLTRAAQYVLLGGGGALIFFPLIWALSASLQNNVDVFAIPYNWLPKNPRFDNYIRPFTELNFGTYLFNSLFVSLCVVAGQIILATLAGFSLAKYQYPGRNVVFIVILATLMLPVQVILVPLYLTVRDLGMLNSYVGLILPQLVGAFSIFLMRQHLLALPDDYLDAARIDGVSELGLVRHVVIPMSTASLSAVAVFSFLGSWDNLLWPMIVVTEARLRTIPVGISLFFGENTSNYAGALAAAVTISIPVIIVFTLMQRQFVEGMARSGLK